MNSYSEKKSANVCNAIDKSVKKVLYTTPCIPFLD